MGSGAGSVRLGPRVAVELVLGAAGLVLLAAAARMNAAWIDRHVVLPYYFDQSLPGWIIGVARGVLALGGIVLLVVTRPRVVRRLGAASVGAGSLAGVLVAVVASVLATEAILRVAALGPASGSPRYELKVGERYPRFGWISRPARTTPMSLGGRRYPYAVNAQGLRAPSQDAASDLSRPALVVAGESIANGFGLPYDETFAARCGRDLGLEVVNVAEGGYGLDQAYLRLMDILPRLQRPAVVVTLVVGPELGRMARDDRPRLVLDRGTIELLPPAAGILAGTRLHGIFHDRLPYLGEASLERSLRLGTALLQAIAREATARGARPLFVFPSVGPPRPLEQHRERALVEALLARPGLPYVLVDLPPDEIIPGEHHPNAAGARR